eukprot:TRINITY_DN3680_c0_g1_i4.p1 TRINITY_DN3680_c0_g1~~TRINITY_DN3680_c0_g1_i4.p1  ORF type:complete len:395 (+),score=25.54 TRINITY_DN3680_c0_g1_i4:124-1308(+)
MGDNGSETEENGSSNNSQRTRCWACNVELMVPQINGGQYAHEYKCGWCGAFNYWPLTDGKGTNPHNGNANGPQKSTEKYYSRGILGKIDKFLDTLDKQIDQKCPTSCLTSLSIVTRAFIFLVVIILVTSLGLGGPIILLPGVFSGWKLWVSQGISFILMYGVSFNLLAASVQFAGRVEEYYERPETDVPQFAFDNFKYCKRCDAIKPPSAHHCRICGRCVVDMDHHCPFINNCVGRTNLRPFMLFLVYVLLSIAYATPLLFIFIYNHWKLISQSFQYALRFTARIPGFVGKINIGPTFILSIVNEKWQVLFALYLTLVCCTSIFAVGFLLHGQLNLALRGEFYINTLQSGQRTISYDYSINNLRKIFGDEKMIYWLVPRWRNPPSTQSQSKKGS